EMGLDTVEANKELGLPVDSRDYYLAAQILRNKNINHVRLLTNNPLKIEGLKKYGINDVAQEKMPVFISEQNKHYLTTKKDKLNHFISF
ncbi:MAG TPA: bifunctional 3,4-dihydroxy-2-butanone-4-phosphate synthase/GTP cyclohydrolase II, partial [Gammaproteobacteria bacterium]|nr:bifunctional 3,4-dihydroxy-2-butanone-4-phosphate synthase/GTP cyclohydrolase II [Gammaproteobacteria bacterium]